MSKKVGRPSTYHDGVIKITKDYIREAVPENMEIATMEGLAIKIGTTTRALYRWAKKHEDFRQTLEELKDVQKQQLVKTGIFGGKEINSNIIMLLLKVNHNMIETTKQVVETETRLVQIDINNVKDKDNRIDKPATQAALGAGDTTQPTL